MFARIGQTYGGWAPSNYADPIADIRSAIEHTRMRRQAIEPTALLMSPNQWKWFQLMMLNHEAEQNRERNRSPEHKRRLRRLRRRKQARGWSG